MRYFIIFLILIVALAAGCTQIATRNQNQAGLQEPYLQILNSSWAFEDATCQHGKESVGYVFVDCKKDTECEVYIDGVRSNYGLDGLQPCDYQLVVADIELMKKPDFVAVPSGDKYYYITRDKSKNIEICCSYANTSEHKLLRDDEVCETTRLEAQCTGVFGFLEPSTTGFGQIYVPSPWNFYSNGTLSLRVRNMLSQDINVTKIYVKGVVRDSNLPMDVSARNDSQNIIVRVEPKADDENSYSIQISFEYYLTSDPNSYFNDTGTIIGMYS